MTYQLATFGAKQEAFINSVKAKEMTKVTQELASFTRQAGAYTTASLLDTLCVDVEYRTKFAKGLGVKADRIKAFTAEEQEAMKSFATTSSTLAGTLQTTVLPVINELLEVNDGLLDQVSVVRSEANSTSFKLNEFGAELTAEILAETAAGTAADETLRAGDTVTPNLKIQTSSVFSNYGMMIMQPQLFGKYIARHIKTIRNKMRQQILTGSNSTQFKGVYNTFGTTADDQEGALTYTATATTPISKIIETMGDLPSELMAGESNVNIYMNPTTFFKTLVLDVDLEENYKLIGAISPVQGDPKAVSILGRPVILVDGIANDDVLIFDPSNYYLAYTGGIELIDDGGMVNIQAGTTTVVSRVFADGGMVNAHKNVSVAGSNDNRAKNAFRRVVI